MEATRTFECLACGTELVFSPGMLAVRCWVCEDDRPLPLRLPSTVSLVRAGDEAPTLSLPPDRQYWRCQGAGCEALISSPRMVTECPCCGRDVQPSPEVAPPLSAHGIMPFMLTDEDAKFRLRGEIVRHRIEGGIQRFERIFVPWAMFACEVDAPFVGHRGREFQGDHGPAIAWEPCAGRVQRGFENLRATVLEVLPADLCRRLEPWDWAFVEPFSPQALGDTTALHPAVSVGEVFERCFPDLREDLGQDACFQIGGDFQKVDSVTVERSEERLQLIMMPMWVGVLEHRLTHFVVNGRTGEVVLRGYDGQPDPDPEELDVIPGNRIWEWIKTVASIVFAIGTLLIGVLALLEEC